MSQIKPEQIRWRVGSTSKDKSKGMLLGYIDSRTAMEFLDAADAAWSDEYEIVSLDGSQGVQCALTVNGVTRTDVGVPSNTEGLKGAYSDALKRAAVKHGIGRELYELPRIWVALDNYGRPTAEPVLVKGRWTLPSGSGSVFYDHEPTNTPQRAASAADRPAAGGAKVAPSPSPAPDDPYADAPPMFDTDPDLLVAEVERVTGGQEIPTDLTERIARAEQKGQQAESKVCPEHGAAKVKTNKRGLYCATKIGDGWCDWSAAA
jgi:hypothetical protein